MGHGGMWIFKKPDELNVMIVAQNLQNDEMKSGTNSKNAGMEPANCCGYLGAAKIQGPPMANVITGRQYPGELVRGLAVLRRNSQKSDQIDSRQMRHFSEKGTNCPCILCSFSCSKES